MRNKNKNIIDKETLWRGLRRKLTDREIDEIPFSDDDFEKDDYYDFKLISSEFNDYFNGKSTYSELMRWLILVERCLSNNNLTDKNLNFWYVKILRELNDYIIMFIDPFDFDYVSRKQERINCGKMFAKLKWYNHNIEDIRKGKKSDFTTDGVITYVSFAFNLSNGKKRVDRVCVVDKRRRHVNFLYVGDIIYRADINYTYLSETEFEDLSVIYRRSFKLDSAMTAEYAAVKSN